MLACELVSYIAAEQLAIGCIGVELAVTINQQNIHLHSHLLTFTYNQQQQQQQQQQRVETI